MLLRSLLHFSFFAVIIGFTFFSGTSATAQTVSAADLGASNVDIYKTSKQLVYGFGISSTGGDATLTALTTQATGGTYAATDIVNFELYYNDAGNDFRSATLLATSGASSGAGEVINFGSFSQFILGDGVDRYFYIAIHVASGAASGNTFSIPFLTSANFTFTTAVTFTSSLGPSGDKTIQPAITYTSVPSANSLNVGVASNITLDFDTDLNLATVHNGTTTPGDVLDDNIKIIGSQSGQFNGVFSVGADNSIVTFDPAISFKAGEEITVTVNSMVTGSAGEAAAARSFRFIAASGPFEGGFKERPTANIAGMADGIFDWGDYDNDGDLDLIVVGFDPTYTASATIYNNVNGVFSSIGAGLTGVFFSAAAWGDYDGDGDLDVVVAGVDNSGTARSTKIYRNDAGAFTDIGAGLQGVDYADLDWGDYDNDGDLDLVVIGRYFDSPFFGMDLASSTIYRNDGNDVFTDIGAGLQALNNGSVNWGDYDADGDLDLVMNGYDGAWSNRYTIIYDNNDGIFTDHLAGLPNVSWGDSDWGDYDNDGDLDLLLSGGAVGLSITSIYNNTGGVFTDINAGLPLVPEGSVRWGDYDGDGNLDVVLTGTDSFGDEITHIYKNSGGGVFTDIHAGLATVYFRGLADFVDFDGDGDLDILVAGESSTSPSGTSAVLYENTIFTPFVTTWKTDNPGSSNDDQITIPTTGTGYFYNVNWGDGMTDTGVTGDITHTYAAPGTYTVSITGAFPRIYFNAGSFLPDKDAQKILTVEQWGDVKWSSMAHAFSGCENLRINAADAPDLSMVTDMTRMFYDAISLNDDINHWDVSNVTNMQELFADATVFNQPLDSWDVSSVTNMNEMFWFARAFDQNIGSWSVDNVTNMAGMFAGASVFNQDISGWNTGQVTTLNQTFAFALAFNQDISGWNTSNVTNMNGVFDGAIAFNQDISGWNLTNVTTTARMFRGAIAFNNDITGIDVSNVTNMAGMFSGHPTFNQDISGWTVSAVTDMSDMFAGASAFNQDISGWDVSAVRDFNAMFSNATSFNQPIGTWTLNPAFNIDMRSMFLSATSFDQDLSSWDVRNLAFAANMLNNSGLSVANYDNLLEGWSSQSPLKTNVQLGAAGLYYCKGITARGILTSGPNNWIITDDGSKCISVFNGPDTSAPEILDGQAQAIDFGSTSTSKSKTFTLLNNQNIPITNVQINNSSSGFPTSVVFFSIAAGASQTFTVDLTATITGTYTEIITITSDDFSGTFQFDVVGEVTATPQPEIAVFDGPTTLGTPILDGQAAAIDLGFEYKGTGLTRDITLQNIGDAVLNISTISFSGAEFSLASIPPATLAVDASTTIQIVITGANSGSFAELMTITSDDADEGAFTVGVVATIIGPDIAVFDGPNIFIDPEIFSGQISPVDFGSGPTGTNLLRTITITNLNPVDLNISNVTITGSAFSLSGAPPAFVAAEVDGIYSVGTLNIMLSGAAGGSFSETVTIFSDDDDEPLFTFPIAGVINTTTCASPPTATIGTIANICSNGTIQLAGSFGGPANGATWMTTGDGTFDNNTLMNAVYTPGTNDIASGSVNFTLTTDDPDGAGPCVAASANVTVLITPAPVAGSPTVQSTVALAANVNVIGASTVATGDVLTVTILQNPTKGTVVVKADKTIDYTATNGTIGADSFQYTICNQCNLCSNGTVSVNILNAAPVITPPANTITSVAGQSVTIPFINFISDLNDNIDFSSIQIVNGPTSNASASIDASFNLIIDYSNTPFAGTDQITIQVCDLLSECSQIVLSIEVSGDIIPYTGISPNGDGYNDHFEIRNIQFLEPVNKVTIYNRWGDKVFEMDNYDSLNPDRRFEGKQNNGTRLPSGVYFYKIDFPGSREGMTGYVTLKQ